MTIEETPAQAAYAAYGRSTGGLNFLGQPMPQWGDLPITIQRAWVAAAEEIRLESMGTIGSLVNMVQVLMERHIQLGTALLKVTPESDRPALIEQVRATTHDAYAALGVLAKRVIFEPLEVYTVPTWQLERLATVTDLTWREVFYAVRDAAKYVYTVHASVDTDQFERIALLRAAAATYDDLAQDLDTERQEPGTHRHPQLLAQIQVADRLAAEAGLSCRIAPVVAHLVDGEERLLLDHIAEAEADPETYADNLPRLRAALTAVQADRGATEYRVAFARIGARGGKNGTEAPLPLTVHAQDGDHLAELIGAYARNFLGSREIAVTLNPELTSGNITVGMGRDAGEFTIERTNP